MDKLCDRFQKFHSSVFAEMILLLAAELGVDPQAIERLGVGYDYRCQAWVFPERNALGDIIGLSYRYENGKKTMAPGYKQKRGLVYPFNQDYGKGVNRYANGCHNWCRVADIGIHCPVCGKPDGCLVSADNPSDPSAAICIRPQGKDKAVKDLGDAGYLHILKPQGRVSKTVSVLPVTDLPILIVEGASDVLAAMSLGHIAIGRPGASAGMELLTQMPLAGKEVWIIGENDAGAGREGMEKTFAVIRGMAPSVKKVMPPEGIKDLRAWYNAGLNQEMLTAWVNEHAESSVDLDPNVFENGQATTFAREFLNRFHKQDGTYTLRNYREDWYGWRDGRYDRLAASGVRGQLYEFLDGKSFVQETANGKMVKPVPMTRKLVGDVVDAMFMPELCPVTSHPPAWLSKTDMPDPKDLIVFKNGILDVSEYIVGRIKVYNPDPDLFVMNTLPYAFNEDAQSAMCLDYWQEIFDGDQEIIRLLHQWFGYNLVPDTTQEKMMLFTGRPRSGKSTTLDMLRGMLGADQCCALQMSHLVSRFGRQPMLGKLAAIFGDVKTPRASEANVALETLLAIIGQDAVSIDRKNIEELANVKLFCRFTMTMNDLPAFSDHARALAPRMNIIYFPKSYVGSEDRGLKPRLEAEAKSGKLVNWALEGLKDLRTRGKFVEPTSSLEMLEALELATSPVMKFVKDCCELDGMAMKRELFDAWRGWCDSEGRMPGMADQFGRWLLNACPKVKAGRQRNPKTGQREYYYAGVRLNDTARKAYLK